ncbi:MAG: hypothetical protein QOG77_611 [Solirubrobacteraceae bacterium]|jgi:hypothetical protein|nr:hypothetical protein [Solirubrobacteraceae bacterium]
MSLDEVQPGIYHWMGHDGEVPAPVHSHYIEAAGVLIDPIVPSDGMEAFSGFGVRPQQVLLTNRRHRRDADRFREELGCIVRVGAVALRDDPGFEAEPFDDHDEVAWGVRAITVGHELPEETVFHVSHGHGAVAFGDTLVHPDGAPIGLPPDDLLGRHPDRLRRRYKEAFRGLLLRDFDVLLLAHGAPVAHGGKAALRRLVKEPVEHPEFGPYV